MAASPTTVSLLPTNVSGLLCNSSPIAAAIAVANTEADVLALAGVVRGKRAAESLSSWAAELYGHDAAPPSVPTTNRSSFASSAQLGRLPPVAVLQHEHQRVSLLLSATSAELSSAGGGGGATATNASDTSAASLPTASVAASASAAATGANAAPSYRHRKNVSWQCTLCGYHVMAMDQDGTPLPFTSSAFGTVLPLSCPRCKLSHTAWQTSTPFSEAGDHMNLPTTLSNRYVLPASSGQTLRVREKAGQGAASQSDSAVDGAPSFLAGGRLAQRAAAVAALATQQRGVPGTSTVSPAQRRAYYCGRCDRRLLRVDVNGELVDMDRDQDGEVLPITCPGCKESHSDWVVKPYAVRR
ncbi:hypothetical protein NESM_000684900 [Novymonas esmeraldas]|uniref:Uncharacterized protein n=1 Tax=Novymonas esmeraldas TaxID=1808958 RepID=A0AAW0EX82_9TRYP